MLPCPPCSEVLQPRYLPRSPQLAFLTMRVVVEGAGGEGEEQQQAGTTAAGGEGSADGAAPAARQQRDRLVFLYRLVAGHAAPSFGVHCAQLAGVPEAALERARHIIAAQASC